MKSRDRLDKLFNQIETVVLRRQHPVTGLLPASTAINAHGNYTDAWVRDNVYSIICVWALGMAYRKHGEEERSDQLEQATVKLMRGLLESMMRQAPKVECFKHTMNPFDALHAKYDTATGLPVVADHAWGHLQIDATSLFLLMLGQMSASGLRIIFTLSEVDFIQNLVYYIASAYRTPDFGIWERGNKINNGKTEINASSLGMAKAALQALDGFNLFGERATARAVIHTVPDSISLARAALASLLPRESLSKEVDSALLSVIGYPAFAVGDKELANKTRDKILKELGGKYGCKRFIWDGHQTALEDGSRLYYQHTELVNFEHIESEWPLFFTFLYLEALFNNNDATAKYYRHKIETLMVEKDGIGLIPELYYLPKENIAAEKNDPGSQTRLPNENIPLVWAQSLYFTGLMLDEDLLTTEDLDPLHMRRRTTRFVHSHIALVVLAENEKVKNLLFENGVIAETVDEISPIGVISAPHLMDVYAQVGANSALGLTGRPSRRLQSLSTSQTYEINGKQHLCLSWIQGDKEDYRSFDAKRIAYKIEQEIGHIHKHWLDNEMAIFTFLMEEHTCSSPDAAHLFKTLRDLQLKTHTERVGYASAKLAYRASRSHKLFIPNLCLTPIEFSPVYRDKGLSDYICHELQEDAQAFVDAYQHKDSFQGKVADKTNYALLNTLCSKFQRDDNIGKNTNYLFNHLLELVYRMACQDNHWMTARYCYFILTKAQNVLADGLVLLASRHLSVVIGSPQTKLVYLDSMASNQEIADTVNQLPDSPLERVLTQEVLASTGSLVRTSPQLFDGIRSIYVHNLLSLCATEDGSGHFDLEFLAILSPWEFLNRLLTILKKQRKVFTQGIGVTLSGGEHADKLVKTAAEQAQAMDTDWLEWRSARGLIPRFDERFLKSIWSSLPHARKIVFGDKASHECTLDCDLARRSMTAGEESFARLIDRYVQLVHPSYYRSAILETLFAYAKYCAENPLAEFGDTLDLGDLLEKAAEIFIEDNGKVDALSRNLDLLIEQSPHKLQKYLCRVLDQINVGKKGESGETV